MSKREVYSAQAETSFWGGSLGATGRFSRSAFTILVCFFTRVFQVFLVFVFFEGSFFGGELDQRFLCTLRIFLAA